MPALTMTPPFVRWTLLRDCPLREDVAQRHDPAATERWLRSLRTAADARCEGREWQGVCLDRWPPTHDSRGFLWDEVLALYGGADLVEDYCSRCPANVLADRPRFGWAGCFGMLTLDQAEQVLLDAALRIATPAVKSALPSSAIGWRGLWLSELPDVTARDALLAVLASLDLASWQAEAELRELCRALELSLARAIPLALRLFPCGVLDEASHTWLVSAHCPQCKAGLAPGKAARCVACGYFGHATPARRRKQRGTRPYQPLARFLGAEGAAALIAAAPPVLGSSPLTIDTESGRKHR